MKTSISKLSASIFALAFVLTACGGDSSSDRRIPGANLNLRPDQIEILTPAQGATNVCRFSNMTVIVKDDPNCDSASAYENVSDYMKIYPASSVGVGEVATTQGFPQPDPAGCKITFRAAGRQTSNTDMVLMVKGTPAGSIGVNRQSAQYRTGDAGNSSCGPEAFFDLAQVVIGGRSYASTNGGMDKFRTPIEELVSENSDGSFAINTSNLAQSVVQMASTFALSFLTGLGTVSTSSQSLVTFEAALDDYSAQYGFRLYQVPGFGTNPLAFLVPQSWTPVDLSSSCVANAQFNNNSCMLFQDGSGKTQILIRPQAAGYVSGTGYVLVVSRGMTSPTGRVLKYTYMIPFVTQ